MSPRGRLEDRRRPRLMSSREEPVLMKLLLCASGGVQRLRCCTWASGAVPFADMLLTNHPTANPTLAASPAHRSKTFLQVSLSAWIPSGSKMKPSKSCPRW